MSHMSYLGAWQTFATIGICTIAAASLLAKLVRMAILIPSMTIMDDLPNAGKERHNGLLKGRAVICGGSIAGLFSAAVCARHFENVLIIESEGSVEELGMDVLKDKEVRVMENGLPTAIPLRKRVVQYFSIHIFLPAITLGLRQLFPDLQKELGYFGLSAAPMTIYNVTFLTGTVEGYLRAEDGSNTLSGVKVRSAEGVKQQVYAGFVVDATGPSQTSFHKWIQNSGFSPLPSSLQITYDPVLAYSQSVWNLPEKVLPQIEEIFPYGLQPGFVYANTPDWSTGEHKAMYIGFVEQSQLIITAGGWGVTANQRPHSIDEIRIYLKSIHQSENTPDWIFQLLDVLAIHEEECAPWYSEIPAGNMSFIKYHQAPKGTLPDNWVAVGDAFFKLNPVYGQGCTKAVMDAITLDGLLRRLPSNSVIPSDFSGRFFHKAIARTGGMWDNTKATDYGWPTTEPAKGETLHEGAFVRNFGRYLCYAGHMVCYKAHYSYG
ncbi:hypothetical protein FRB93_005033 [Tulasnella sp. JGI-2019a]|nr:hypothetical protein FRB93_005033 [Tulasnella sp. JGI-2019a]